MVDIYNFTVAFTITYIIDIVPLDHTTGIKSILGPSDGLVYQGSNFPRNIFNS